jgi:alkylated DNA repair dioxygenase AlkB
MDLFTEPGITNLLPKEGTVFYYGKILNRQEADTLYTAFLENIAWKQDEAIIFGKHITTARKVAWYGESSYLYTYSNTTKQALPWTPELQELKKRTEEICQSSFNSCLLNLYHSGEEGMAWHSDGEKTLGHRPTIASWSFGAERNFSFKHKASGEKRSILLEHGSLLLMKEDTQQNWLHRLPPTARVKRARVNLTFRTIQR